MFYCLSFYLNIVNEQVLVQQPTWRIIQRVWQILLPVTRKIMRPWFSTVSCCRRNSESCDRPPTRWTRCTCTG
uniref:Uncharacterized protein n=1 Tax=Triticum urartu TaxID=4572 RepID=A0A8R7V1I9_TRIUA